MKSIYPKTALGKWSLWLGIIFIILMCLKIQGLIPLMTFLITAVGLAGFVLAIVSIIKNKDRRLLVFLPVIMGIVIILWILGEIIFPH